MVLLISGVDSSISIPDARLPSSRKSADIYGYQNNNLRLCCDHLEAAAGQGCTLKLLRVLLQHYLAVRAGVRAVAPDILGDTALKRGDFPHGVPKFLEQNPFPQKAVQVEAIVEACSSSKVGLLGFCWGAKPCVMAAGTHIFFS